MTYNRLTAYFFSGTGNSYRAARWMAAAAADRAIANEVIPIAKARPREDLRRGAGQLVGIYHPTHGFMPPWSMIRFLVGLPRGRGAHAFVVATRGAFSLRPVLIPGGAGMALFLPLLVLLLKGYRLRGGMGIDMPANMLNVHWGLGPAQVDHVIAWGRRRHRRLAGAILSGRRYWHPLNVLWELVWCIPFGLWPLFPIAYLSVGRVFMAKLMFADADCKSCGRCARNCPRQAIAMVGPKPAAPFWTHRCEACMRCMGFCRFRAVQASHLWILPVGYGVSFLTAARVQNLLAALLGWRLPQMGWELLALLLTLLSLPLFYYVFWGLQRIKAFRVLFTYTTLTRFHPRRYHAPATTARELNRRSSVPSPDPAGLTRTHRNQTGNPTAIEE